MRRMIALIFAAWEGVWGFEASSWSHGRCRDEVVTGWDLRDTFCGLDAFLFELYDYILVFDGVRLI